MLNQALNESQKRQTDQIRRLELARRARRLRRNAWEAPRYIDGWLVRQS